MKKIFKVSMYAFLFCFSLLLPLCSIRAKEKGTLRSCNFDLEINNATYNSASGTLTITGSNFGPIHFVDGVSNYYTVFAAKFLLNGRYRGYTTKFDKGILILQFSEKEAINSEVSFSKNGLVSSGLYIDNGGMVRTIGHGINVELPTFYSCGRSVDVTVIGHSTISTPKITGIEASTSSLNSGGGLAVIMVYGSNLDKSSVKLHSGNTVIEASEGSTTSKKFHVSLPKNELETNRTNTFHVSLNDSMTDYKTSIVVLGEKIGNNGTSRPPGNNNMNSDSDKEMGSNKEIDNTDKEMDSDEKNNTKIEKIIVDVYKMKSNGGGVFIMITGSNFKEKTPLIFDGINFYKAHKFSDSKAEYKIILPSNNTKKDISHKLSVYLGDVDTQKFVVVYVGKKQTSHLWILSLIGSISVIAFAAFHSSYKILLKKKKKA